MGHDCICTTSGIHVAELGIYVRLNVGQVSGSLHGSEVFHVENKEESDHGCRLYVVFMYHSDGVGFFTLAID